MPPPPSLGHSSGDPSCIDLDRHYPSHHGEAVPDLAGLPRGEEAREGSDGGRLLQKREPNVSGPHSYLQECSLW